MSYKDKEKQKEYQREWARNKFSTEPNQIQRRERQRKHYNDSREKLEAYKLTLCCSKCGENHPATLDFHHIEPDTKEYSVGRLAGMHSSWERIMKEIEKCIVLCSNCHRILHWETNKPP